MKPKKEKPTKKCACPFAWSVSKTVLIRASVGLRKYGVTCERSDLSVKEWLDHLQQELLDGAVYIEKLKSLLP